MKTSYSRAWGMQAFHGYIYEILNYRAYGHDITYPYIIHQIFGINYPHQITSTTPTSASSNVSVGEWIRRNERIGR